MIYITFSGGRAPAFEVAVTRLESEFAVFLINPALMNGTIEKIALLSNHSQK